MPGHGKFFKIKEMQITKKNGDKFDTHPSCPAVVVATVVVVVVDSSSWASAVAAEPQLAAAAAWATLLRWAKVVQRPPVEVPSAGCPDVRHTIDSTFPWPSCSCPWNPWNSSWG